MCLCVITQLLTLLTLIKVFDFSQAQRNAHAEEFAITCLGLISGVSKLAPAAYSAQLEALREEAKEYQKGCQVHFKTSVNRIKQDLSLVTTEFRPLFDSAIETILSLDSNREEFDNAISILRETFPGLKGWIKWWIKDSIAHMIFPACSKMSGDLTSQTPDTSNPVESHHSLLHHGSGKNHDPITGMHQIWLHVNQLKGHYDAIIGM